MKRLGGGLRTAIADMERTRYSRRQRQAMQMQEWLGEVMDPRDAARLAGAYACQTPDPAAAHWTFAMISPAQNDAVIEWLYAHSKRPQVAVRIWSKLFTSLRPDTGEVMLTRQQMAERVGVDPGHVSRVMTELASINAVRREKRGREMRYFMSPHIATHIPSPEARTAARDKAGPLLVLMDGGKADAS